MCKIGQRDLLAVSVPECCIGDVVDPVHEVGDFWLSRDRESHFIVDRIWQRGPLLQERILYGFPMYLNPSQWMPLIPYGFQRIPMTCIGFPLVAQWNPNGIIYLHLLLLDILGLRGQTIQ